MDSGRTSVVILGVTGDLARRKLVPALFNLWRKGRLPEPLDIVGFARSEYSTDRFCDELWGGAIELAGLGAAREEWDNFAGRISYIRGDLSSKDDMVRLEATLREHEGEGRPANRLFYLSIAPHLYEPAIENLGAAGLAAQDGGWRRVVIEKPFGRDLESARHLNSVAGRVFDEGQMFRIDHYLGKETVQNLLVLRFANAVFEPLWNRNYVDNVQVTVAEQVAVDDRAGYYDRSGIVRDMVQNHLLQLVAMVAMEPPITMDAESLRDKKVDVLKAIRRWRPEESPEYAVAGQYRGYLQEEGVPPGSATPTYAAIRLYIDNWRWQGVPFYLRTGKAMAEKVSEIIIQFRMPPHSVFSSGERQDLVANVLGLCIQPDEGAHLRLEAKIPDQGMSTRAVDMEFHYESAFAGQAIPEAYERLLQDALDGDARLFIRSDHIEEAWRIVDPLLQSWDGAGLGPPHTYEPGSWGPQAADALLAGDGRTWNRACGIH